LSATNLPPITLDSHIVVRPLSKQLENGVVIIGRYDEYLELPPEGLDFLGWLDEGLSLAQARERFEFQHNPLPDEDLWQVIDAFLECDFIAEIDGRPIPSGYASDQPRRNWFPPRLAKAMFSKPVLLAWLIIAIPATAIWVFHPEFWPKAADYFWTDYYFVVVLVGILLWLSNMIVHELAHWVACQAKGIEATITWTQRLGFFPMSQTIMHNIWAMPRSARLLPIAAGMMWDILIISVGLYLLFFDKHEFLVLPLFIIKVLKFHLLTATIALAAQFWLFSRMDGYFLLSALMGQRNLQADTFDWLKSRIKTRVTFQPPAAGMKFIYLYVLIIVFWGGLFMGQFLLIDLPIKLQLLWESFLKISSGVDLTAVAYADGVAVVASQLIFWGLLFYAYWRENVPTWRRAWSARLRLSG
jgi:hypothetical protein